MAGPILADGDVVETKIGCFTANQAGINVRHWIVLGHTGISVTTDFVALVLDDAAAPLYKPLMHGLASFYGASCKRLAPGTPSIVSVSATHIGPGTGGMAPLPNQVSGVITLLTAMSGRSFRGRMYIPFPADAFNDATTNTPVAGYKTLLNPVGSLFVNNIVVGGGGDTALLAPIIWRPETLTYSFLNDYRSNQKWGTQRRRGNYGAANSYPPF